MKNDIEKTLEAFYEEWNWHDEPEMWSNADGWWVSETGELSLIIMGNKIYENTSDFVTPDEAKLAAYLINTWDGGI